MSSVSISPTLLPEPAPPADAARFDGAEDTRPRVLVVQIAGIEYGIAVEQAREVIRATRIVRVPGAPPETLGVVNVRGSVVTVLDPATILHGVRAVTGASIVLIENGARLVGFAVDAVRDVRAMEATGGEVADTPDLVALDAAALCARFLISAEEMGR